jgi:glyoxylase-like metal-dependent hydrolase (beta-lactamase superfamily II)
LSGHRAQTTTLDDGITAVDTEYGRPLLDASHLINEGGRAAFVDTGANSSVPLLLDALGQQDLDPGDVDYVFLTHIHLDHAGGAGLLMQSLPNARCIVHPRGAPHLVEPAKLIAGTEAVYGEAATRKMYGDILPLDAARVVMPDDGQRFELNGRELRTFYTEGHALHHYCIDDPASRGVFTGDSFGVSYRELDTAAGPFIFPASTPTHFDPVAAHKSVDLIMGCNPEYVYVTHYSRIGDLQRLALDMHEGIDAYAAMALAHKDTDEPLEPIKAAMLEFLSTRLRAHGYSGDDAAIQSVIGFDTELNAKGLVSWLQRLKKQG